MLADVFVVTGKMYPKVFEALETISHDCGGHAGHYNYAVPLEEMRFMPMYENILVSLTPEELQTFCIGEEIEMKKIAARGPDHEATSRFLNDFFDDWPYRSPHPVMPEEHDQMGDR